jgi:curved DNA-binding protein CbpA
MGDHYQTLGLPPNATLGEVEAAFADIAERYHPSKHKDNDLSALAAEKLAAAEQAYSILRDTRLRSQYDRAMGLRPNSDSGRVKQGFTSALMSQLPSLAIKGLWLLLTFTYVKLVKNPKIILFTLAALALIWGIKKMRKR